MANKPAGKEPMNTTAMAEEDKAFRLELPSDLHKELRIDAVYMNMHMYAPARTAAEEFLERARNGGGK
jgi:hypothetical protein